MLQSQSTYQINSSASINITAKLRSDGKNWREWHKQITNAAVAMSALSILDGSQAQPVYDPNDETYRLYDLYHPTIKNTMSEQEVLEEAKKVFEVNKYLRPLNEDKVREKERAESAHCVWGARDAQLQNLLLSSVDIALSNAIHSYDSAHKMYEALKGLHIVSDHDNLCRAWGTFTDLRAEDCKSIHNYVARFQDALHALLEAGVTFEYKPPSNLAATNNSNEEFQSTVFVHGLRCVVPKWCEQCEDELRQGNAWTLNKLFASLSDYIRRDNNTTDPVKAFNAMAKQLEENRALSRLTDRGRN